MDREKVKAASRRGSNGSRAKGAQEPSTVSETLGKPTFIELGGKDYEVKPITFNDLILVEAKYGDMQAFVDAITQVRLEPVRFLLWLVLRKTDKEITEEGCGELLPINQGKLLDVFEKLGKGTGLLGNDEESTETEPETEQTSPSTGNASSES